MGKNKPDSDIYVIPNAKKQGIDNIRGTQLLRAVVCCIMSFVLAFGLYGCGDEDIVSDKHTPDRVKVQVNEDTCEEAGSGTVGSVNGDIGDTETNAKKVYSLMKEMGFSDENIAGVLGNWAEESGIDPSGVETIFDEPFQYGPKKKAAMEDHNNFTLNTVFPAYEGKYTLKKEQYKDPIDNTYYPGVGLAGYTGHVCKLMKFAEKNNVAWYSFDLQLAFAIMSDEEGYGRNQFWEEWGAESSPESAAETFLAKFEGCPGMKLDARQKNAREWYEKIKTFTVDKEYAQSILAVANGGGSLPKQSGSTTSAISESGEVVGNDVAEQCWNYLKSIGMSDEAAAACLGNFEGESGMNPANIQGNGAGPAAGLYQMEKYGDDSSRWGQMKAHAESKGKDWTDLGSQLEFLDLDGPGQFNSYTGKTHTYHNGTVTWWPTKMTWDEFKAYSDIDEATEIFMRVFERPSVPHLDRRQASAHEYYERFKGTAGTNQSTTSEACETDDGRQSFGSSGVTNGEDYVQFQGNHYEGGSETGETDSGAMSSACGATSFTMGVNMLLGEKHKYCGVEVWKAMGSDSTTIGWGSSQASDWLKANGLENTIEVTGGNDVQSREDLLKKLQEGNVVVASSKGNVFKNADGSTYSSGGHYILFYKCENGTFYADDGGHRAAGGGVAYSADDVDAFFNSPSRNGGGSLSIKRK